MSQGNGALQQSYKSAIARIHGKNNKVIGAGFLVPGGVLTCAHVVRDALGLSKNGQHDPIDEQIKVSFPYSRSKTPIIAEVVAYEYCKEEDAQKRDTAALRLLGLLPVAAAPVLRLSSHGLNNTFRIIGFPSGRPEGREAVGEFMSALGDDCVQIVGQKGYPIQGGFSGSAVWDETVEAVVGMTVAVDKEDLADKVAFMIPAISLIEANRLLGNIELLDILTNTEASDQAVLLEATCRAYELCAPDGWQQPTPDTLKDQLNSLQEMPLADNQYEAIDRFAALLSLPNLLPDATLSSRLRNQLEGWAKSRAEDFEDLLEQAKKELARSHQTKAAVVESLLFIHVTPVSEKTYPVLALFVPDIGQYDPRTGKGAQPVMAPKAEPFEEKVTAQKLPDLIRACEKEIIQKSPRNLIIHLILPLALLHEACDRCNLMDAQYSFIDEVRVGTQYRLVVRIAERWDDPLYRRFGENWEKKWHALLRLASANAPNAFIRGDGLAPGTALRAELMKPVSYGLKLSQVCKDSQQFQKAFGDVIVSGTPAAVWLRSDEFAGGFNAVQEIDTLLRCKVKELPEVIKQTRSNAVGIAENAHIGHHLSFLWDDITLPTPKLHPDNRTSLRMS